MSVFQGYHPVGVVVDEIQRVILKTQTQNNNNNNYGDGSDA